MATTTPVRCAARPRGASLLAPSACGPHCSTPRKKKEFVAGVPRQRPASGPGTRDVRCQSDAPIRILPGDPGEIGGFKPAQGLEEVNDEQGSRFLDSHLRGNERRVWTARRLVTPWRGAPRLRCAPARRTRAGRPRRAPRCLRGSPAWTDWRSKAAIGSCRRSCAWTNPAQD